MPGQVGHHLFVGHGQNHRMAGAVLKTGHFRANLRPAPGFLPDIGRMHHGHGHLLPADGRHFFPHDVLDLRHSPSGQGQIRENPRAKLADEARPQQ